MSKKLRSMRGLSGLRTQRGIFCGEIAPRSGSADITSSTGCNFGQITYLGLSFLTHKMGYFRISVLLKMWLVDSQHHLSAS